MANGINGCYMSGSLQNLTQAWNKPLVFTETGTCSGGCQAGGPNMTPMNIYPSVSAIYLDVDLLYVVRSDSWSVETHFMVRGIVLVRILGFRFSFSFRFAFLVFLWLIVLEGGIGWLILHLEGSRTAVCLPHSSPQNKYSATISAGRTSLASLRIPPNALAFCNCFVFLIIVVCIVMINYASIFCIFYFIHTYYLLTRIPRPPSPFQYRPRRYSYRLLQLRQVVFSCHCQELED